MPEDTRQTAEEPVVISSTPIDTAPWLFLSTKDVKEALKNPAVAASSTLSLGHKRDVVNWIVEHAEQVAGDASDWQSLCELLINSSSYSLALDVALAARRLYPSDASLLGVALLCAGKTHSWEIGDRLIEDANNPDCRWNETWYLSIHVSNYLRRKAAMLPEQERDETLARALAFVRAAKERIRYLDRLYCAEAELLVLMNRVPEARQLLESVIFLNDADPNRQPTALCCMNYLKQILSDENSCEYDKIIVVADAGIRYLAKTEESVKPGYLYFRKALAMDGKIHADYGRRSSGVDREYIREALKTYALAYAENWHRDTCRKRFRELLALSGIDDMDIQMYCDPA